MSSSRGSLLFSAGIAVIFFSASCLSLLSVSSWLFVRSKVVNYSDPGAFQAVTLPDFIEAQNQTQQSTMFSRQIPATVRNQGDPLARALAIQHWVHQQQPIGESWRPVQSSLTERVHGDSEDPATLLAAQRSGYPVNCRRFSLLFTSAAVSAGLRARLVIASENFRKPNVYSHVLSEVWIPAMHQWVLMDPLRDASYRVGNAPASLVQIFNAARQQPQADVVMLNFDGHRSTLNRTAVHNMFRHIFVARTNAYFDGYQVCFQCAKPVEFAHLSTPTSPDYPESPKAGLLQLSVASGLSAIAIGFYAGALLLKRFWLAARPLPAQNAGPFTMELGGALSSAVRAGDS